MLDYYIEEVVQINQNYPIMFNKLLIWIFLTFIK